jgi:hypothetical protein
MWAREIPASRYTPQRRRVNIQKIPSRTRPRVALPQARLDAAILEVTNNGFDSPDQAPR